MTASLPKVDFGCLVTPGVPPAGTEATSTNPDQSPPKVRHSDLDLLRRQVAMWRLQTRRRGIECPADFVHNPGEPQKIARRAGRCCPRRWRSIRLSKEKAGENVLGLIQANYPTADEPGSNRKTGRLVRHALGIIGGQSCHIRGTVHTKGLRLPVAEVVFQEQVQLSPEDQISRAPQHPFIQRLLEAAHEGCAIWIPACGCRRY